MAKGFRSFARVVKGNELFVGSYEGITFDKETKVGTKNTFPTHVCVDLAKARKEDIQNDTVLNVFKPTPENGLAQDEVLVIKLKEIELSE